MNDLTIISVPLTDVERLRPLWEALRQTYVELTGERVPIRGADESWARRRSAYERLLAEPGAFALGCERDGELLGYALVHVVTASPVFGWADRAGELETLVVAAEARNLGVGARLTGRARERLAEHGIHEMVVHVLATNERALDFYRREGFEPYQVMLSDAIPAPLKAEEVQP